MTSEINAQKLNRLLESKVLAAVMPPEDLTVTQWAEKNRRLSAESAAETGPWRTQRTPYLRAPMDAFTDPKARRIVMVAASQVGKSEFLNNVIGYIIDEDPGSILFVHPTSIDAKEYSKLRIAPMIRDCPTLRKKVSDPKSRDSGNTIQQKSYPGGIPEADILCEINLLRLGSSGGSGGSVDPGVGLGFTMDGKLNVQLGSGLSVDGSNHINVDRTEVVTDADMLNEDETAQSLKDILLSGDAESPTEAPKEGK